MVIKHFIFINDSTGELDWIAPYLSSLCQKENEIEIYLNLPRFSRSKIQVIFSDYFSQKNIRLISMTPVTLILSKLEFAVERIFSKIIKNRTWNLRLNKHLSSLIARLIWQKVRYDYDFTYLDYNLKNKAFYQRVRQKNKSAKVVIFPHSTAIMTNNAKTPKPEVNKIQCDIFLENTHLNNAFSIYSEKIKVVGSPTLDMFRDLGDSKLHNRVLFLTRRFEDTFSMKEQETLETFQKLIKMCEQAGYSIDIKHHPRDLTVYKWRAMYGNANISEAAVDISNLTHEYCAVFSVYSSAPVLFAARAIPTFDFTCYDLENLDSKPYHYMGDYNTVVHELIDLGIIQRLTFEGVSDRLLVKSNVRKLGIEQKKSVDKLFKQNAIENIRNVIDVH